MSLHLLLELPKSLVVPEGIILPALLTVKKSVPSPPSNNKLPEPTANSPWTLSNINSLVLPMDATVNLALIPKLVVIPRTEKQNASMVHEYLLSKGIAVRDLSSYGLKDSIRITLGLKEELDKTIMALKEFVKKNAWFYF